MFMYTLLKSEGNRHKSYCEGKCQELITDTASVCYTETGLFFSVISMARAVRDGKYTSDL